MDTVFTSDFSQLNLNRFPLTKNDQLRAWDAADEYILSVLYNEHNISNSDSIVVFNDSFGAISLSLTHCNPLVVCDSYTSELGIIANQKLNSIDSNAINICNSLDFTKKTFDCVLIKSPNSLDFLFYFISQIRPYISDKTTVLIAGMAKHLPKNIWNQLESRLGSTQTTPGKKKAKVIKVTVEKDTPKSRYPISYTQDNTKYSIINHANVFSKKSLDIGSRFLIQNLPQINDINRIIDLGCGNGIIGLNLAKIYPEAQITFIDESYMAVDSARLTLESNIKDTKRFHFKVNYCLNNIESNSANLIVCNPPFHQNQTIGIDVALKMFSQSHKVLSPGSTLIVIANKHLPYFSHLKRTFKSVEKTATNQKFLVFTANK